MAVRVLKYLALTMAALLVIATLIFGWVLLVVRAGSDLVRAFVTRPSRIDDAAFSETSAALTDASGPD